jgi:hypothetical protein
VKTQQTAGPNKLFCLGVGQCSKSLSGTHDFQLIVCVVVLARMMSLFFTFGTVQFVTASHANARDFSIQRRWV